MYKVILHWDNNIYLDNQIPHHNIDEFYFENYDDAEELVWRRVKWQEYFIERNNCENPWTLLRIKDVETNRTILFVRYTYMHIGMFQNVGFERRIYTHYEYLNSERKR